MEQRGYKAVRFALKLLSVFVVGIMISMVMLTNMDTYSWFTSAAQGSVAVSAASTADILEKYEVEIDKKGNAVSIKLQKNECCIQNPMIYFSVQGEAAKYILGINPVRLETNEEYIIPIKISPNAASYINLAKTEKQNISGIIKIKYLNEFINEEKEIQLTKEYVLTNYYADIYIDSMERQAGINKMQMQTIESEEYKDYMDELIIYAASHRSWDDVKWIYENSLALEEEEFISNPISKAALADDQSSIIDVVAPKLREYIDKLYSIVEDLVKLLNEKLIEIKDLTMKILVLEEQNTWLEKEKKELITQNEELIAKLSEMEQENASIAADNENLKQTLEGLENQKADLEAEITKLSNQSSSSGAEADALRQQIGSLENIIDGLRQQINQTVSPNQPPVDTPSGGSSSGGNAGETPNMGGTQPTENPAENPETPPQEPVLPEEPSQDPAEDQEEPSGEDNQQAEQPLEELPATPIESTESQKQQEQKNEPSNIDIIDKLNSGDSDHEDQDARDDEDDNGCKGSVGQTIEPSAQVIRNMLLSLAKYK